MNIDIKAVLVWGGITAFLAFWATFVFAVFEALGKYIGWWN